VFGIGADVDVATWRVVLRQIVAQGLAEVDHASYGALKLCEAARPVLKGEARVMMRHSVARPKGSRSRRAASVDIGDVDAALLARLKAWRLAEARAQSVPAFVIFNDRTLAEIARVKPASLGALRAISGVGEAKLARYGDALLGEIAAT
jgi:ATP-dependent DNA helicase RecQ